MQGPIARRTASPKNASPSIRNRTPSPSRRYKTFQFEPVESDKEQALRLEQDLVQKYIGVASDREMSFLDDVYALAKKIPFLQSRSKEDLRRIALKTKEMELSIDKNHAELKGILVQAVEASLESAHIYLSKSEPEKFGQTLEKCSKLLVLMSVDEPLNPVLHIKYDLVRSLAEGISESSRYQMLQSVLVKLQSQPKMEYITAVVHLLINLAHFRIEGKLSYNHVKNATSFFVRRLGLNGETKPDTPDPDLYLLSRKLNLNWKEQQDVFSLAATCIILIELCLRIQQKEILADSANLANKCKFYVSCLSRQFRKLLEAKAHVICERMQIERKMQLLRDPEFGKSHGIINRNFLAKNIQVSVNKAHEKSVIGELGNISDLAAAHSKQKQTESGLLLFKSAEPRSQEEIERMEELEKEIPKFIGQVDDAFMAKYSIPQEFIQARENERLVAKRNRKNRDLFRTNVKFDWSGNTRWVLQANRNAVQQPEQELEARKNTIPSEFQDQHSSEEEDNISVDHELKNLVGLISRQKLSQLTPGYKAQPSQLVKRRFTINTIIPIPTTPRANPDSKLNESEHHLGPDSANKMDNSSHTLAKKSHKKLKEGLESGAQKYRGMNSFYYKETFRKNPEYLFSQRPSDQSSRTTATRKLPIQNTSQPLPEFVTAIDKNKSAEPHKSSKRVVLTRQSSAVTLRHNKPQLRNLESGEQQGNPGSAPDLLKMTRRKSVTHRVTTSTRAIHQSGILSSGLLAKGIPSNEPFLPSEIEELQGLLTLAERRTSEDLMTKRNPTKAKRLLRKAMGFILEHGTKGPFPSKQIEQESLDEGGGYSSPPGLGRFESLMLKAQTQQVDAQKPHEPKYATSKLSSKSQLNNSLVHWADQQLKPLPAASRRKLSTSAVEPKAFKSERLMDESQDHSIAKSISKPGGNNQQTMLHALVTPKVQPSKWGTLKNHLVNKGTGEIQISSILRKIAAAPANLETSAGRLPSGELGDRRKSTFLNVASKSEASNATESMSVKRSKKTSSKKDSSATAQPASLTEEAARRKRKAEQKRQLYRDNVGKLVAAIRKIKRKRYVYMLAKLKMNWVTSRNAEPNEESCPPRVYPHTGNPTKAVLRRTNSQIVVSGRKKVGGFTLQSEEIYAVACFLAQNTRQSARLRFELKHRANKNEAIELGLREEPHQYVIKLDLDNDKLHAGRIRGSSNQWRVMCDFLRQRLADLDPSTLKSIQVVLPHGGFKNEQTNKKTKLLLGLLTLLVSEQYLLVQKTQGYRIVPKEGKHLEMCEITDSLRTYYERQAKDTRSLLLPEFEEPISYGYLVEDSSQPTDDAIRFLALNLKNRNRFFELNRTTPDPGYFDLDESMQARRSQIKKVGVTPTIHLNPVYSAGSANEAKPDTIPEGSVEEFEEVAKLNRLSAPINETPQQKFLSTPNFAKITLLDNSSKLNKEIGSVAEEDAILAEVAPVKSVQPKKGGFFALQAAHSKLISERKIEKPTMDLDQVIDAFDLDETSPIGYLPSKFTGSKRATKPKKTVKPQQTLLDLHPSPQIKPVSRLFN